MVGQRASGRIVLPETHRIDGVHEFSGLAELHETLPQVVKWTFHQDLLLLVVVQQVIPQRLFGQGLRVSHNYHTVSVTECKIINISTDFHHHFHTHQYLQTDDRWGRLPCSSQRNIQTSGIVEETDALVLVGPHTRQDDEVLLSALKGVHTCNFHFLHKQRNIQCFMTMILIPHLPK